MNDGGRRWINYADQLDGGSGHITIATTTTATSSDGRGTHTSIHITALDGIMHVNSLFTLAVFIGFAWNPTDPSSSLSSRTCSPGKETAQNLVSFHVFAFSAFLFSSLIALCMKTNLQMGFGRTLHGPDREIAMVNRALLRGGILCCAVGSVFGCGFLMLALVNVVQIKLGRLGCGSPETVGAVAPLVTLIPAALIIYVGMVFYAFTR